MSKTRKLIIVLIALFLLLVALYRNVSSISKLTTSTVPTSSTSPIPISHYRPSDVQLGISQYPPRQIVKMLPPIRGGVVPHHLVAQLPLAAYFQNLSQYPYKRVILLGPNHDNLGDHSVVTSLSPWETPYGLVGADTENIKSLDCASHDEVATNNEHSLEVLMPFVKTYLPLSSVIPLHLKRNLSLSELKSLRTCLLPLIDAQTLILASVDFSHYLSSTEASQKDRQTLGLIKQLDYEKLLSLSPDHLDSPPSLVLLLMLMQASNSTVLEVSNHTDASVLTNEPHQATTTHYYLNYYVQE